MLYRMCTSDLHPCKKHFEISHMGDNQESEFASDFRILVYFFTVLYKVNADESFSSLCTSVLDGFGGVQTRLSRECAFGGVYLPCSHSHARWSCCR